MVEITLLVFGFSMLSKKYASHEMVLLELHLKLYANRNNVYESMTIQRRYICEDS